MLWQVCRAVTENSENIGLVMNIYKMFVVMPSKLSLDIKVLQKLNCKYIRMKEPRT